MLGKEDFALIQALVRRGVYLCDVAQELGVHPKTVSRAVKRGGAPVGTRKPRGRVFAPYQATVDRLLGEGVWNAKVIFRELQAQGYPGGLTVLKDDIRPKRALRVRRRTVRFETGPGKQLQSDWGTLVRRIGGVETEIHFMVNTLGFSRRFHVWNTDSEDASDGGLSKIQDLRVDAIFGNARKSLYFNTT